jgi:2-amino-4-hydroxy-6-hydroxymethyldihydropteridine diphosphokinase
MNSPQHRACLLLGSNIRPEHYLPLAVRRLHDLMAVIRVSPVWETHAVGSDGPNFLNAAVLVRTDLEPQALKEQVLRPLEAQLGRLRGADKFAPRTIDLDVLLWDDQVVEPALWQQAHAAVPAARVWLPPLPSANELAEAASRLESSNSLHVREDVNLE